VKESNALTMDDWKLKAVAFVRLERKSNKLRSIQSVAAPGYYLVYSYSAATGFNQLIFF